MDNIINVLLKNDTNYDLITFEYGVEYKYFYIKFYLRLYNQFDMMSKTKKSRALSELLYIIIKIIDTIDKITIPRRII